MNISLLPGLIICLSVLVSLNQNARAVSFADNGGNGQACYTELQPESATLPKECQCTGEIMSVKIKVNFTEQAIDTWRTDGPRVFPTSGETNPDDPNAYLVGGIEIPTRDLRGTTWRVFHVLYWFTNFKSINGIEYGSAAMIELLEWLVEDIVSEEYQIELDDCATEDYLENRLEALREIPPEAKAKLEAALKPFGFKEGRDYQVEIVDFDVVRVIECCERALSSFPWLF